MARPALVARGVEAMRRATTLPVTVKHRIGIDNLERYEDLARFVGIVARSGCDRFIVHARIAVLQGLSPRDNRTIPPLRYADVYNLKQALPELRIEINGGVTTLEQVCEHLHGVDGVMVGRAAYDQPYLFALADTLYFDDAASVPTRRHTIEAMIPYLERWLASGLAAGHILRHMLGLCAYQRVAKAWKRYLSDAARQAENPAAILPEALRLLPDDILDARPALPHGPPFVNRTSRLLRGDALAASTSGSGSPNGPHAKRDTTCHEFTKCSTSSGRPAAQPLWSDLSARETVVLRRRVPRR